MTGYVARDFRVPRRYWTGAYEGWSPARSEARVFEFATVAALAASRDSGADPTAYDIEPVFVADQSEFFEGGRTTVDAARLLTTALLTTAQWRAQHDEHRTAGLDHAREDAGHPTGEWVRLRCVCGAVHTTSAVEVDADEGRS